MYALEPFLQDCENICICVKWEVFSFFFFAFFLFVCSNSSVKTCNQCPNLNIFWKVPFPNRKSVSSCQKKIFVARRHILCNIALNFSCQIFIALQNMSTNRRLQNGKQPPNTCHWICDFYYTKMLLVTMATKRRQPEGGLYLSQSGSFWMYMHMLCLVVDSSDWRKWEEVTHSVLINNGSCFVPLGCKIYIKNIVAQTVIFIRQETC